MSAGDADIDLMCRHFWEVYLLWDRAFLLARTINPANEDADAKAYQTFLIGGGERQ